LTRSLFFRRNQAGANRKSHQVLDDNRFLCAIDDVSLLEQAVVGYFGRSPREIPIQSSPIKRFMGRFRSVMSLKVTMAPTV
jgi:hypothetical protein